MNIELNTFKQSSSRLRLRRVATDSQIAQIKEYELNPDAMNKHESAIIPESNQLVSERKTEYSEQHFLHKSETYQLIGIAMEVHRYLGYGFSEIVYKDALIEEFNRRSIQFECEKKYEIEYRGIILPHHYFADFVIENKVILEIKAQTDIHEQAVSQVLNYLAASKLQVGLILNFGESSLKYKRVVLSKDYNKP